MIRVCYVIPSLDVGGTERQLLYLLRGLAQDHELTVLCTRQAGTLAGDARRLGVFVHAVRAWSDWDFTLERRIARYFRGHRPDIVHSFLFGFDLPINRAARDTGVPVIISTRRELATWKKPRHIRLQKKANRLVGCIVANSRAVQEFAIEQEKAPRSLFRVIPNGIDADAFASEVDRHHIRSRLDIPFHTHVIGIVANFSPVKDHALFIEIAKEIMRRRADVHFLMAGSGPLQEHYERVLESQNLADRFTRTVTLQELPDLYRLMSVSVLCSINEGFPNAIMESMAAGTPVVAAAVGGIPELIEDGVTGRLVASRDPRDFADAIQWVLDHPEESRAMAERAAQSVRAKFSVETMIAAYRSLYAELLAEFVRKGT